MTNWMTRWGKRDDQSGKTVEAQPTIPSVEPSVLVGTDKSEPSPVKSPAPSLDPAVAKSMPYRFEEMWRCASCGHENRMMAHQFCEGCAKPRPSGVVKTFPQPTRPMPEISAAIGFPCSRPATLCEQISDALGGIPVGTLKKSGVTVNTLVRAKSGEGIRLETLEKIARYLGWTITITDKEGNPIVRAS